MTAARSSIILAAKPKLNPRLSSPLTKHARHLLFVAQQENVPTDAAPAQEAPTAQDQPAATPPAGAQAEPTTQEQEQDKDAPATEEEANKPLRKPVRACLDAHTMPRVKDCANSSVASTTCAEGHSCQEGSCCSRHTSL